MKNHRIINWCNIYILLWIVYYLQGVFYVSGGFFSRTILIVFLAVSFYFLIKANLQYRIPRFLKALNVFIIVTSIYGVLYMMFGDAYVITEGMVDNEVGKFVYLKKIYTSLLPIYAFYVFSKQEILSPRYLQRVFIALLLVAVAQYYYYEQTALLRLAELGSDREDVTNNAGYQFVALMPLLLLWNKKPLLNFALMAVIVFFVVSAMKRGAIVICAGISIYYLVQNYKISSKRARFLIIVLTILLGIFIYFYVADLYANNAYFQYRLEHTIEGDSSNRSDFYSSIWNYMFTQASPLHLMLGYGPNYSIVIVGNYAHNDWFEILADLGLLGILIYAYYYIALLRDIKVSKRCDNKVITTILQISFFSVFMTSLFSMSYAGLYLATAISLGYGLAQSQLESDQELHYEEDTLSYR